jgi:hypothetical protein
LEKVKYKEFRIPLNNYKYKISVLSNGQTDEYTRMIKSIKISSPYESFDVESSSPYKSFDKESKQLVKYDTNGKKSIVLNDLDKELFPGAGKLLFPTKSTTLYFTKKVQTDPTKGWMIEAIYKYDVTNKSLTKLKVSDLSLAHIYKISSENQLMAVVDKNGKDLYVIDLNHDTAVKVNSLNINESFNQCVASLNKGEESCDEVGNIDFFNGRVIRYEVYDLSKIESDIERPNFKVHPLLETRILNVNFNSSR